MNAQYFKNLALKGRPKIGVGVKDPKDKLVESLKKAQEDFADIIIVGVKVDGFENVSASPEEMDKVGVELYYDGKIEGYQRGQGDAYTLRNVMSKRKGYVTNDFIDVLILETSEGEIFFYGPGSQPQGWTKEQKIRAAEGMAKMVEEIGQKPKIAFLTAVRPQSRGRNFFLDWTYEIADECVEWAKSKGWAAKNYNIEMETAIAEKCNVIIPPNGIAGNQASRSLVFVAKFKNYGAPPIGMDDLINENFRNDTDLYNQIMFLTARINKSKGL